MAAEIFFSKISMSFLFVACYQLRQHYISICVYTYIVQYEARFWSRRLFNLHVSRVLQNFFNNKRLTLCVLCALCGFEKFGLIAEGVVRLPGGTWVGQRAGPAKLGTGFLTRNRLDWRRGAG
jgi:hypothetical protein